MFQDKLVCGRRFFSVSRSDLETLLSPCSEKVDVIRGLVGSKYRRSQTFRR